MVNEEKSNKIWYYRVPITEDSERCRCCGGKLKLRLGRVSFFFDDQIGRVDTTIHYCEVCDVGFKTSQELEEDKQRINQSIPSEIRIETISDPSEFENRKKLCRSTLPANAKKPADIILLGVKEESALHLYPHQLLNEPFPTVDDCKIAIRALLRNKDLANAGLALNALNRNSAMDAESLAKVNEYYDQQANLSASADIEETVHKIPLPEEIVKQIKGTIQAEVVSVSLCGLPARLEYVEGQELNIDGCSIAVQYRNGESEELEVKSSMITGYDKNRVGMQRVCVSYAEKETFFNVTVSKKQLLYISIDCPPEKHEYVEGDLFDPTGMAVSAHYNNGIADGIREYKTDAISPLRARQQSVSVYFQGEKAELPITVLKKAIISLTIDRPPAKTDYFVGDIFCADGMIVTALYNNGSSMHVMDYDFEPQGKLRLTDRAVTVAYQGKTVEQAIAVTCKSVDYLTITDHLKKRDYVEGETVDYSGLVVKAVFVDGSEEIIEDYSVSPDRALTVSDSQCVITFGTKCAVQDIIVRKSCNLSRFAPFAVC